MRQGKDDRAGLLRRLARRQRERPRPDVVREGGANSGAIRNAAPFRCLNARYERMVDGVGASKARRFGLELQRDLDLLCFGHGVPRIAGALLPGTIRLPDRGVATLPRRLEAQDLRGVELIGRRRMLVKALKKAGPALRFSEHMESGDGEAMFRHACALGLEGIVSKRVASRYKSGSEFFLMDRHAERSTSSVGPSPRARSATRSPKRSWRSPSPHRRGQSVQKGMTPNLERLCV